ncbi:hypothetical protein [Xanthobacter agilis]|uniref:YtxH domain-containing protein n=1 Tax=Xanthobacter agilis TaxID=47492 RepID=A0ABU0LH70_XANAG|nr:hypothetical protein [Xanthobacter agilis]MDQ0506481.1 hypothetical protein [Xanthobacter agilis]
MSDDNGASQGVHYHYHFYGYGPAAGAGEAAPHDGAPGAAPGPLGMAAGAPQGDGRGGDRGQRGPHGQAGAFPPGYPPPGFPFAPGAAPGVTGAPGSQPQGAQQQGSGFNWHQHPAADSLIKGLVVGAGAAYLLTNETAQRTILRTAVQVWGFLQGSVEELKERLHDAEAEVAAAATPEPTAPADEEVPTTLSSGS